MNDVVDSQAEPGLFVSVHFRAGFTLPRNLRGRLVGWACRGWVWRRWEGLVLGDYGGESREGRGDDAEGLLEHVTDRDGNYVP